MKVALVGCGLVGRKRSQALAGHRLLVCADPVLERARAIAADFPGCEPADDPRTAIAHPGIEAVLVCTTHDALAPTALAAIDAGKHVLVEKPGARTSGELKALLERARVRQVVVKVGFNHRFHPALAKAHAMFRQGDIGELMYIRGRYGHGGRLGYEKEWRAQPEIAGGGELLDQGSHLIDLSRWFAGDFVKVWGRAETYFWPMPVEDNAFLALETATRQLAWLHASWTEWKNLFCFEVFGRTGKLQVEGLGGSYGPERLTWYRMKPEMGPPDVEECEFSQPDVSWAGEFDHFAECVDKGCEPSGSLRDALAVLEIIEDLYGRRRA